MGNYENAEQGLLAWTEVPKVYWITYRQASGSCFSYRNEIIMGISTGAVRKLAELMMKPGERVSAVKHIYPLQPINL
ncbi:hypothetical protein B6N60_01097 [Richelia sinica FACHB-800]|uniref:Uncharacterized protein n=1 Tax=Richelia sinica FACHB-800 TaxID=1357546 RepID=A0A975T5C9_9NOST|nr:hypothetical protein [Richelia sinica]MBD2664348.1 hypothetical protein [Richelia sinica FACHB-800]QXE22414.1 hypothetical protein B6N60_01097 [Richelia sinica FACHB-800]